MDRGGLADFLRRRREGLAPADVGLAPGPRRRAAGLRREEVAALTGMSVDYYGRLEQGRSPQPSPQMLRALARTLRLTDDERAHLFRLAGQEPPARTGSDAHVRPGVMRLLDRFTDGAAFVVSDTEVTLAANRLARLLLGDHTGRTGRAASAHWRWFTDPAERARHPAEEHAHQGRIRVADLRATWSLRRGDADVTDLVDALLAGSDEFAALWAEHHVAVRRPDRKQILHPAIGAVEVDCEILLQPADGQRLVLLTAASSAEQQKLDLLAVVGAGTSV